MTITPTPEQEEILAKAMEAGLIERAEDALNVGLETLKSRLPARPAEETAEEWIARFHAWVESHAGQTVVLSDEAMSRDSIYGDRGVQMAVLIDTNVLLRGLQPANPSLLIAQGAIDSLRESAEG